MASIGGFVREYQVDVRPESLTAYDVGLGDVMNAVRQANRDVGAKTVEINKAEYFVRGLGYIENIQDLEQAVIKSVENVPVRIADVARVTVGPATRRGALDKDGIEQAGGVVVARYGANPMQVITGVKEKISEISSGLPSKTLSDGTVSQVTIVPFYDRSGLIRETLGTLEEALTFEVLITILVIIVMVLNLRASFMISLLLPLAILMVFIAMKYTGVMANIVALSGIAIAIGTMVDLGIILTENVIKYQEEKRGSSPLDSVYQASAEVSGAIVTAVATTIVSFIPVFALEGAEGKLFRPLAFTKTFALIAAVLIALFVLPALAHWLTGIRIKRRQVRQYSYLLLIPAGILAILYISWWPGIILIAAGIAGYLRYQQSSPGWYLRLSDLIAVILVVWWLLAAAWIPVGVEQGTLPNLLFVLLSAGSVLTISWLMIRYYRDILVWCLANKKLFLTLPVLTILMGITIWLGFSTIFKPVAAGFDLLNVNIRKTAVWSGLTHTFPGIGEEFMPSLDEGSFLLMPTSMPHAGMEANLETLKQLDVRVASIPEVREVVGKLGRAESALDPAPISMYENVINYHPEYMSDDTGSRLFFETTDTGKYLTISGDSITRTEVIALGLTGGELRRDRDGEPLRLWRDHIQSPDDIWSEIVAVTNLPGVTSAPKLQPIETRLVMLQTGMRAPMGIKVSGPSLKVIESFGLKLEDILKKVPSVKAEAVFADRVVGKPYLEIDINRQEIARYGLTVEHVQQGIEGAIGGVPLTMTVEGRERYPIRVRYPREQRTTPEQIGEILITAPDGTQVPLGQLSEIEFTRGPQMIRSEETFLTSYVLFDKREGFAEVTVVNDARTAIDNAISEGRLKVPAGVTWRFSGSFENQVRAEKRLALIIPVVLVVIFLILYFQFRSSLTSLMIFSGIAVAFGGGFLMLWFYGQDWFADFTLFGQGIRDLFQMGKINLSVAVWVGFIALFGIATDDGVLMATYLEQSFARRRPEDRDEIRAAVVETRVGPQQFRFSLSQMFPWFGTLGAQRERMDKEAEAAYWLFAREARSLVMQVRSAYYELWMLQKLIEVREENLELTESLETLSTTRFRSGDGRLAEVLRVQLDVTGIQNAIEENREELDTKTNQFFLLLGTGQGELSLPDTIQVELPAFGDNDSLRSHPSVQASLARREAASAYSQAARKAGYPSLGLGLDYLVIGKRDDMTVSDNGKNALMPMVTIGLPIRRKKYRAMQEEATAMERQYGEAARAEQISLLSQREEAEFILHRAMQNLEIYTEQADLARRMLDLTETDFANDRASLDDILEYQEKLLEYREQQLMAYGKLLTALTRYDYITGEDPVITDEKYDYEKEN